MICVFPGFGSRSRDSCSKVVVVEVKSNSNCVISLRLKFQHNTAIKASNDQFPLNKLCVSDKKPTLRLLSVSTKGQTDVVGQ